MADETWGKQMSTALRAVRNMHKDASRLLIDLDRVVTDYKPVYGSHATMDLTYSVHNGLYMADGLLRHWKKPAEASTTVAANIVFWDDNSNVDEPLFVAAKMLYADALPVAADKNKAWDPWYAFLNWTVGREYDVLREANVPTKRSDVLRVVVIGALYEQSRAKREPRTCCGLRWTLPFKKSVPEWMSPAMLNQIVASLTFVRYIRKVGRKGLTIFAL